jgi:hypothetical protein
MYNEDGSLIDTTSVYVPTSGVSWLQQELLDIYNDAIKQFMVYMVKAFPTEKWWELMPGYVYNIEDNALTVGKLDLSTLTSKMFQLIDCKSHGTNLPTELATFVPQTQWYSTRTGFVKTRKPDDTHIFYTIMADDENDGKSTLFVLPATVSAVDLIYLKDHTDYVQNNATPGDLAGISQDGLRRVLMFAEVEARRWKSTEAANVPEASLKMMTDLDSKSKGA